MSIVVNRCSEGDIGLISDIRRCYWFDIRYAPASYRKISDTEPIWYVPGTDHICFISDMKHGVTWSDPVRMPTRCSTNLSIAARCSTNPT